MKTHHILLRIALLVFLTLLISACTQSSASQNEIEGIPAKAPTDTPSPKPTNTSQPTTSPTPNTTWRGLAFEYGKVYMLAMDPVDPHIIYAGVIQHEEDQLFKSLDGGESWTLLMQYPQIPVLYNLRFPGMAIDPDNPDILYVGVNEMGMFKSLDGGETWQTINVGLIDFNFNNLIIDPNMSDTLYASSSYGIFKTIDGGQHWQNINDGLTYKTIHALTIDPQNSSILYVGTNSGVFKSIDAGANWKAYNSGLIISTGNMGYSAPSWIDTIAVHPYDSNIVYLGGYGVFKSSNGGITWEAMNEGLAFPKLYENDYDFVSIYELSIDPNHPETMYGTWFRDAVFQTKNDAENWTYFVQGLDTTGFENALSQVLIDYSDSSNLYVGTGNGLFTTRLESLPTTIPTPTPFECTGGWTQLKVNTYAKVSGDEGDLPNRVRSKAGTESEIIYQIYPGEVVKLIEGPICLDNLVFWKVENANIPGGFGWTAEGDLTDYWLLPYTAQ